ncbi:Flp pilus assembly pilin Flp [Bradyrhizobium sp. S3.12.5]
MQLWFPQGPASVDRKSQAKSPSDAHKIELSRFTQSWIVEVHCSRAVPTTSGRSGKDMLVKLKCLLVEFASDESGATAIEYGLIAAGIALAIIEVIYALGTNLVAKLQSLATALK